MPPAKCDVIPSEHATPFAEKRACTGCRRIKSRCIIPPEASICTRCARLNLECTIPEHHRGVKMEPQGDRPPLSSHSSSSAGTGKDSAYHAEAQREPSPITEPSPVSSTNPFSVQSLLDTTSTETSASKALLSSTAFSHLQQMPSVKVAASSVSQPLIEHVITAGLFDGTEVQELVEFYYEKLNPIIALLDTHIYTLKALKSNSDYRLLLAAICTVAAKFVKPDRYTGCLDFLKPALARIAAEDVAPQLETIQSLSILAMWKHPKDGSSWRKVRLAVTQSFELGLHELFSPERRSKHPPSRAFIQSQRTFLQLGCFEDGYRDQRHLPPAIDPSLLPEPREWIDSLGDMVQDIDVRLAASRENAMIKRDLISALKASNAKSPNSSHPSRATCLRNARLIKMTITAETSAMQVWKNPPDSEIPCQHSGRPCLLFHTTNTLFNYHRALFSIYSSPYLSGPCFSKDRQEAFQRCSELSVELFELLNGPYGQESYYRYVHDIVILNLAVAAIWICDNWRAMPNELASKAATAIRQAADATAPSMDFHQEQGSYLARFLRFCCRKLPSTVSIHENSPVGMDQLIMSEDARWAMGLSAGLSLPSLGRGGMKRSASAAHGGGTGGTAAGVGMYHTGAAHGGAGARGASSHPASPHHWPMAKRQRVDTFHSSASYRRTSDSIGEASLSPYDHNAADTQTSHAYPSNNVRPDPSRTVSTRVSPSPSMPTYRQKGNTKYTDHHHHHHQPPQAHPHHPHYLYASSNSGPAGGYSPNIGSGGGGGLSSESLPSFTSMPAGSLTGAGGHSGAVPSVGHGSAVDYVSDSLVPPSYPVHWDTDDDNSIITFLQSISSTASS